MIAADTNIFLYALNAGAPEHSGARAFPWKAAEQRDFACDRIYDARWALTLRRHGVTHFATRNVKHFEGFGFRSVWDPLA